MTGEVVELVAAERPREAPVTGVQPTSRLVVRTVRVGRDGDCHVRERERRRSRRGRTPLELQH